MNDISSEIYNFALKIKRLIIYISLIWVQS